MTPTAAAIKHQSWEKSKTETQRCRKWYFIQIRSIKSQTPDETCRNHTYPVSWLTYSTLSIFVNCTLNRQTSKRNHLHRRLPSILMSQKFTERSWKKKRLRTKDVSQSVSVCPVSPNAICQPRPWPVATAAAMQTLQGELTERTQVKCEEGGEDVGFFFTPLGDLIMMSVLHSGLIFFF